MNDMHDGVLLTTPIWNRLSKRVQGELNRLAADGDHFRNRYRKAEALKSDTRIRDYDEGDYGIPDGSTVIFTGSTGDIEVTVQEQGRGPNLPNEKIVEVRSSGMGRNGKLSVRPRSSNVVEVGSYD